MYKELSFQTVNASKRELARRLHLRRLEGYTRLPPSNKILPYSKLRKRAST
jgi:hypothetical protein